MRRGRRKKLSNAFDSHFLRAPSYSHVLWTCWRAPYAPAQPATCLEAYQFCPVLTIVLRGSDAPASTQVLGAGVDSAAVEQWRRCRINPAAYHLQNAKAASSHLLLLSELPNEGPFAILRDHLTTFSRRSATNASPSSVSQSRRSFCQRPVVVLVALRTVLRLKRLVLCFGNAEA